MTRQGRLEARGILASAWRSRREGGWFVFVLLLVALVALGPIALVALTVHVWLRTRRDRAMAWAVALAAVPVLVGALALTRGYWLRWFPLLGSAAGLGHYRPEVEDVATVAVYALGAGPVVGALYWRVDQWWRERAPHQGEQTRKLRERVEADRRRRWAHTAQAIAHGAKPAHPVVRTVAKRHASPLGDDRGPVLGRRLAGDLPRKWGHDGGLFRLVMGEVWHLVILGATRVGKSEAAFKLARWAMRGGEQVIYLNCKEVEPGKAPSLRLAALAERFGLTSQVLVKGTSPYDPMTGDVDELRNRLLGVEMFTEPYYRHISNLITGLALDLVQTHGRRIEALPQLVGVMRKRHLADLAKEYPQVAELVDRLRESDIDGAFARYASVAYDLRGWAASRAAGGWSFDDADVCVMDLPTATEKDSAKALLRLALADLLAYITDDRRRRTKRLTVIVDEMDALDADPVLMGQLVNVTERAAGAGVRLVIIAHDPGGLGDDRSRSALLTNCTVITFQQGKAAEDLSMLAGTVEHIEASASYDSRWSPREGGSARVQEAWKLHPNMLRGLKLGECAVLHRGDFARVAVTLEEDGYISDYREVVPELARRLEDAKRQDPDVQAPPPSELRPGDEPKTWRQ